MTWGVIPFMFALQACAAVDDPAYVGDRHLRDLRPAPFHVAVRTVQVSSAERQDVAADSPALPRPTADQLAGWNAALVSRLEQLNVSDVQVDSSDAVLGDSPYDLGIEIVLDWQDALRDERHNLFGSFLAWGFLWPFSVTSIAAVKDRSYDTSITATVKLVWTGADEELVLNDVGPLLLSLPERQPSVWWKLVAFTPVYFWVPDDATERTRHLHEQLLDRLALQIARLVKLDDGHIVDRFTWQGDYFEVDPPVGVQVRVVGGIPSADGARHRFVIPREAATVRMAVERTTASGLESWTQTVRRQG